MAEATKVDIAVARPDTFAAWATMDYPLPEQRFCLYRHIVHLASMITNAIIRGRGRLIVNMPPQHGKSLFLSRWLILWYLSIWPQRRVISASYSRDLVRDHSRFVRDEFARNPKLATRLRQDSRAVNRWNTIEGGGMYATTIGGQVSGFPGDLILLDDPYKGWREAWSYAVRRDVQDWFDSELYMRRQEHTTFIVLHTRWHEQDLTHYLKNDHVDDWTHLVLPGLAVQGDALGRKPGEPLCPELHSERSLRAAATNDAIFEAVVQQDPRGLGGARVYDQFSDLRHTSQAVELVDTLPLQFGVDFNVNPGMHITIGQYDPSGLHLGHDTDVFTTAKVIHGPRMDTRAAMEAFGDWLDEIGGFRWSRLEVYGDATGRNATSISTISGYDIICAALDRLGVPYDIILPGQNPAVKDRIDAVNDALYDFSQRVHWWIDPSCGTLIRDLKELPKGEDGLIDKSKRNLSHATDADGYRIWYQRPITGAAESATSYRSV